MRNVVLGFLGTQLDKGRGRRGWRPTVSLVQQEGFEVDRIELIHDIRFQRLAEGVAKAVAAHSPDTEVLLQRMDLADPWDFQEVYGKMFDFARAYGFDEDRERYYVHLTTGTNVAQICWFLLTESRHVPARLLKTGPPREKGAPGIMEITDLDLSRYDAIQQRFDLLSREHSDQLKGGIETQDPAFNLLIERVELAATKSDGPILLSGETGTGKTELARRIHQLKKERRRIRGPFVQVDCAALAGEGAQAALFGMRRGAGGAQAGERTGLLREAEGGVLFLDEIDMLGLPEQAMLLNAVETGSFRPVGADRPVTCRFHVIAGSNRDLRAMAAAGTFRADLLARLDMWAFTLPPLRDRRADIEGNLAHELARAERLLGARLGFNADARAAFLRFARDPASDWPGNFRDFGASVLRLCTLAPRGRVTRALVEEEAARLRAAWAAARPDGDLALIAGLLGEEAAQEVDPFDRVQLAAVIRACRRAESLSAAGRALFSASRARRASVNDADRLRKYLARFGLDWGMVRGG